MPGPSTVRYGGNTSCVEIRADGEIIVLDAGTGIRELGNSLEKEFGSRPIKISLLISHVHWDHIQGFPFFGPAYNEKSEIQVFGYDGTDAGLRETLKGQMAIPFFPVELSDLPGKIVIRKPPKMEFDIGDVHVRSRFMNHPGVCAGYRLDTSAGAIAYLPDTEPYQALKLHSVKADSVSPQQLQERAQKGRAELIEFLTRCDVLILDVQYTDEEYRSHVGWGHGSIGTAVGLGSDAQVKKLVLFHHDPNHHDAMLDEMVKQAQALAANSKSTLEIIGAREGDEIVLPALSS